MPRESGGLCPGQTLQSQGGRWLGAGPSRLLWLCQGLSPEHASGNSNREARRQLKFIQRE